MSQKRLDKFETVFKTEPIFCDESPIFDEINLNLEIGNKCGDVFFRSDESKFSLNCGICRENFKEFTSFTDHYLNEHNEETKEDGIENLFTKTEACDAFAELEEDNIPLFNLVDKKPLLDSNDAEKNTEDVTEANIIEPIDPKSFTFLDLEKEADSSESDYFPDSSEEFSNENDSDYESLECENCKKKFQSREEIETHQEECFTRKHETTERVIVKRRKRNFDTKDCKKCKTNFDTREDYLKHVGKCRKTKMSEVTGVKRYFKKGEKKYTLEERTCKICGRVCANISALGLHSRWHLDFSERTHKCEICNRGFNVKAHLDHHLKFIHGPKLYECDLCFLKFNSIIEKNKHQRAHSKEFKALSVEVGNKKDAVLKHIELGNAENMVLGDNYNVPDGYWRCDICHKMLGNSYRREEHLKFHEEVKPFVCELCGKTMVSQQVLTYHMLVHNNDRKFECEKCGSKFYIGAHLKRHLRTACNPDKKFQCTICFKKFSRNEHLESHKSIHSAQRTKDYSCDVCGNQYSNTNSLAVHKRKHLPGNPELLTCEICHGRFSSKGSLQNHLKRHKNKDKFPCDQCDKKFSGRQDLKQHIQRNHSGVPRPTHNCHICGKPYKKKQDLNAHVKKHVPVFDN